MVSEMKAFSRSRSALVTLIALFVLDIIIVAAIAISDGDIERRPELMLVIVVASFIIILPLVMLGIWSKDKSGRTYRAMVYSGNHPILYIVYFIAVFTFYPILLVAFYVSIIFNMLWRFFPADNGYTSNGMVHRSRERLASIDLAIEGSVFTTQNKDLKARLQDWVLLRSAKPCEENAAELAGEEGERKVIALLESSKELKDSYILAGRRVPKTKDHHLIPSQRSEIDIILLSHRAIHVIEVKNWSGHLAADQSNDDWIRGKRDGSVSREKSPVLVNNAKAWSLLQYLRAKNIPVNDNLIKDYLFLVNRNLTIDDNIAALDEVVTASEIGVFMRGSGVKSLDRIIIGMMKLILDREKSDLIAQGLTGAMPVEVFQAIKNELSNISTWDRIELYGGVSKTGDILKINVNGKDINKKDLQAGEYIQLKWKRNQFVSLLFTLFGKDIGKVITAKSAVPSNVDGFVNFHFAGQQKPAIVPIVSIDRVLKG